MFTRGQTGNSRISTKQMKEAIHQSGYLLEQRIEPIIRQSFFYVESNPIYHDPDTGKSREIDIRGMDVREVYKDRHSSIFPVLLCECENNSQPIAFFTHKRLAPDFYDGDIKISGIPVKFWYKWGFFVSLASYMHEFHHYFKGDIATQYCTFQLKKDRSSWLAFHNEEQHNTFNSLIKSVDYEIDNHFKEFVLPESANKEALNIQIYYPLLIIQDDLYSAYLKNNRLVLEKAKHIQFHKQLFSTYTHEVETYQIDVITEAYLPHYLQIIEQEIEMIRKVMQRKKRIVFNSIEKIVQCVGEGGNIRNLYKDYWEF
jgi:hypothetical protein